jgi:hypothetical protein
MHIEPVVVSAAVVVVSSPVVEVLVVSSLVVDDELDEALVAVIDVDSVVDDPVSSDDPVARSPVMPSDGASSSAQPQRPMVENASESFQAWRNTPGG